VKEEEEEKKKLAWFCCVESPREILQSSATLTLEGMWKRG